MITRRCDYWYPDSERPRRCEKEAEYSLITDDDRCTGPLCEEHAEMVTGEYREKLGWQWRMVRL